MRQLLHHGSGAAWYHGLDTASFATDLSNYFADKVKLVKAKVDAGLKAAVNTSHGAGPPSAVSSTLQSLYPVTPSEVRRLLLAAPAKTSPLDSLPISIVKACSTEFSVILANMANLSFSSGRFPTAWKDGLVSPLLKKPGLDPADFKNFRLSPTSPPCQRFLNVWRWLGSNLTLQPREIIVLFSQPTVHYIPPRQLWSRSSTTSCGLSTRARLSHSSPSIFRRLSIWSTTRGCLTDLKPSSASVERRCSGLDPTYRIAHSSCVLVGRPPQSLLPRQAFHKAPF